MWKKATAIVVGGTLVGVGAFAISYLNSPRVEDKLGGTFEELFVPPPPGTMKKKTKPKNESKFAKVAPKASSQQVPVLILFGTEYGFSQDLAWKLEEQIRNLDITGKYYPRVVDMEDYTAIEFDKEQIVLIVTSTYGDGVPPTRARPFFDWLETKDSSQLNLSNLKFSVLALGDKSYPYYCRAGKMIDAHFERLGAERFFQRIDIDLEDWNVITKWIDGVLGLLPKLPLEPKDEFDYLFEKGKQTTEKKNNFDRRRPFYSKLKVKRMLTVQKDEEDKETIHFEFDLAESEIKYIVGDSLGILPRNCPDEVNQVIKALGIDGNDIVKSPSWKYPNIASEESEENISIFESLSKYFDLKNIKPKILQTLLKKSETVLATSILKEQVVQLKELLAKGTSKDNELLTKYCYGREIIDVLTEFNAIPLTWDEFIGSLGQLLPRYYSISSTSVTDPKTVSVTIAIVRYNTFGRKRKGTTTCFLADRVKEGDFLPIFVNNNPDFRLPTDLSKDILMVGPGTGLAPFMGMLHERLLEKTGKNILYFGCRRSDRDFLYKDDLGIHFLLTIFTFTEKWSSEGKMILRTAFSREGQQKVYVQNRIKEDKESVWTVIENGGHIYICGDAQYMAVDVQKVLVEIICEYGKMEHEDAEKVLRKMESEKRFQRDVWF